MAEISPFRGLLYNADKVEDLAQVVTPPYDVISPEKQAQYLARHQYNVIRLILNPRQPSDNACDNPHTRAAVCFSQWQSKGVLEQDSRAQLYLTSHSFSVNGDGWERLGLIAAVRLAGFEDGVVRPHEKTFSKVKSERLSLMQHTHANFSPIFGLFPDAGAEVFGILEAYAGFKAPCLDFEDEAGHGHRMWKISDARLQSEIRDLVADKEILIADGHHRYETALNYLSWLESERGALSQGHPARYVMMYLCSMDDPGLVILPAHRMLSRLSMEARANFLKRAPEYFDPSSFAVDQQETFLDKLGRNKEPATIGVVLDLHGQDGRPFHLLTIKPGVMDSLFAAELAPELRNLDVTVLTRLVFMELLGLGPKDLDDATLISYDTNAEAAARAVVSGTQAAAFLLNPTRIEHVRAVAGAGLTMPRKSTYFYPKVITGLVMRNLANKDLPA